MDVSSNSTHTDKNEFLCRLCRSKRVKLVKKANVKSTLESKDFKITDGRYGLTLPIFECEECGFLQCLNLRDTTDYYRNLEDREYENSRKERMHQARMILKKIIEVTGMSPRGLRLLDVGAGSGILLEAAADIGIDAEGVEPSPWLQKMGQMHGCKIDADVIPHAAISGPYDIVTLIDVVEHVATPLEIIQHAVSLVKPGGFIVIITPDVKSVAARLMGWKWWHYRIAHVGYFSKRNLECIFSNLGLHTISVSRPSWSFSISYIRERLFQYLPAWLILPEMQWMHTIRINLNLRDSVMLIARRP